MTPSQHLIKELNEDTISPENFAGRIGKQLESRKLLDIVIFKVPDTQKITIDESDFGCDKKYLQRV